MTRAAICGIALSGLLATYGGTGAAQDTLPWNTPSTSGDAEPGEVERGTLPEPVTGQPLEPLPPTEPTVQDAPASATRAPPAPGVGIDPAAEPRVSEPPPIVPNAAIAPPRQLPPGWNASPRVGPPAGGEATRDEKQVAPPAEPLPGTAPSQPAALPEPPNALPAQVTSPPAQATAPSPPPDPPAVTAPAPASPSAAPSTAATAPPAPPLSGAPTPGQAVTTPAAVPLAPGAAPNAPPLPEGEAIIAPDKVEVRWRLENPFRFFADPNDTNVHRATFLALSAEEREQPILAAERALSRRHPEGWASTMFRKTCWDRSKNVFACEKDNNYINPERHTIVAELTGANDPAVTCVWRVNPRGEGARPEAISKPCNEPLVIDVPYPEGAALMVEIAGRPLAQADVKVRDILVAGMGDSFASGEGNPDGPVRFSRERTAAYGGGGKDLQGYPARVGSWKQIGDKAFIEENARWLDQACHRSLYSFELRTALQLALEDPHRAVTYVGVACSGAEVTAGLFLRYKGNEWVPNPPLLSQISAIAEAQCGATEAEAQDLPEAYHMKGAIKDLQGGLVLRKCAVEKSRKIDLLLVSIGGNDIGFSRLLANAVLAEKSLLKKLGGWFGEIEGQLEASAALSVLDQRYKSLNRALHNILHLPWEESDRVILAAYPPIALLGDGTASCPDGSAGMEVLADFRLSEKRARDGTWVADKLQHVMADSAKAYGWTFADAHRKGFVGRGICAGYTDNAFSIADDLRMPRMANGKWVPYNPADYRAYASRQRWFRTPNDAFLTGNFHVSPSLLQKALKLESLSWFQLLLASTYSGAFHPTAEGHAAIADSVADKARGVLKKYKQQSPELTAEAKRAAPEEARPQFP